MSFVNYVLVLKTAAHHGASNPHLTVSLAMPRADEVRTEQNSSWNIATVGSCLLCDYLQLELRWESASFARTKALWRGSVLAMWLLNARSQPPALRAMDQLTAQECDSATF